MPYRHIVLFRLYDGCRPAEIAAAIEGLEELGELPGILEWTVRRSEDERKGVVIVQNALFESREALTAFSVHPAHQVSAARLAKMADWWIGDHEET